MYMLKRFVYVFTSIGLVIPTFISFLADFNEVYGVVKEKFIYHKKSENNFSKNNQNIPTTNNESVSVANDHQNASVINNGGTSAGVACQCFYNNTKLYY